MIQSSACQPWHVDLPGLAGEYGGLVGTYTIPRDTIHRPQADQALRAKHKGSGCRGLVHEYSLSSQEGVALMCLAEALLRIPDMPPAMR
jgi:hypothetical protein